MPTDADIDIALERLDLDASLRLLAEAILRLRHEIQQEASA
jgi:hypothetical protein